MRSFSLFALVLFLSLDKAFLFSLFFCPFLSLLFIARLFMRLGRVHVILSFKQLCATIFILFLVLPQYPDYPHSAINYKVIELA